MLDPFQVSFFFMKNDKKMNNLTNKIIPERFSIILQEKQLIAKLTTTEKLISQRFSHISTTNKTNNHLLIVR